MKTYQNLLVTLDEGVAIVKVNRPEALNALNGSVLQDLSEVFDEIAAADEIGGVVLTGEGKAFVAGADIAAMREMAPLEGRAFTRKGQAVMAQIEAIEKPVVAAVNGFALGGGCELSMACDIRFASEKAKFGQPEVNLGIVPGFGGTQRLQRLVGRGMAKFLIYGADMINAEEALRIGLVQRVFAPEELIDKAVAYVKQVLTKAPVAVRLCKAAINCGADMDLNKAVAVEAEAETIAFATEDRLEGMTAFLEKRPAVFKNK
jgi:enoyl-CoA hydratase